MRKSVLPFLLVLSWMLGGFLPQQENQAGTIFRITSSQVRVDFVAVDKQGRFVNDLRAEEVEVFEDGKKQTIVFFFAPAEARKNESLPARATKESASPTPGAPANTVLVIDSRTIDSNNFVHSVSAIRAFIENHLSAGHSVMLAEVYRGLRVLAPLTRDKAALLAGLDKLKPQSVYNPLSASASATVGYIDELSVQVPYLREALTSISYSLAGQTGRKHVVLFSEGYPLDPLKEAEMATQAAASTSADADTRQALAREAGRRKDPGVLSMVREVVSVANSFGVSFYTVDARGLVAVAGIGSADRGADVARDPSGQTERIVGTFTLTDLNRLEDARNTLIALAAGTSGLAFYGSNDLSPVLRYSTLEQQNYYLAGYAPSTKRKSGEFHHIEVRAKRPGLMIRSRKGYVDVPDNVMRTARVSSALKYPELFGQLAPLVQVEPSKGKSRVVVGVPASQIQFRQSGDKYEAQVAFLAMVYDGAGKPVSKDFSISKGFNLALTAEQFQGLGNQPLLAQGEVQLSAGKYRIVLVAEDRLAGSLGAATQEFLVP